jgi:predicted restriction endonuclease
MLAKGNPSARTLLSPWLLSGDVPESNQELPSRPLVSVRRRLRDSRFGRRVRNASGGRCGACLSVTNYDKLGILEAAHIRSVEEEGSDELSNALALCPNHHALFDEGKWTLNGKKIIFGQRLPEEVRKTFGRQIRCSWDLDERELDWHRTNVFQREARDR